MIRSIFTHSLFQSVIQSRTLHALSLMSYTTCTYLLDKRNRFRRECTGKVVLYSQRFVFFLVLCTVFEIIQIRNGHRTPPSTWGCIVLCHICSSPTQHAAGTGSRCGRGDSARGPQRPHVHLCAVVQGPCQSAERRVQKRPRNGCWVSDAAHLHHQPPDYCAGHVSTSFLARPKHLRHTIAYSKKSRCCQRVAHHNVRNKIRGDPSSVARRFELAQQLPALAPDDGAKSINRVLPPRQDTRQTPRRTSHPHIRGAIARVQGGRKSAQLAQHAAPFRHVLEQNTSHTSRSCHPNCCSAAVVRKSRRPLAAVRRQGQNRATWVRCL